MSTTLFFLVPVGMAAVVWSLCFVGCPDAVPVLTPYSDNILSESSLVAYWPLSDLKGSATAQDLSGHGHTGTYTIPPAYPTNNPQSTPVVPNPPVVNLQQGSIVPGDGFVQGISKNLPFSVDFEGGYISIPWSTQNSPTLTSFTLEAWVKPNWTQSQSGFFWVIFGAITGTTGFALSIGTTNHWEITVGNGQTTTTIDTMVQVTLGSTTYVAVTFQSTGANTGMLSLWINPDSDTSAPPPPAWPTAANPPPTTYFPVDPTQPVTFFIGAGDSEDAQTLRTTPMGPGAPLYPFLGQIQSVALYQTALGSTDLESHFQSGASSDTDT
jgi:hypothetical protein